MMAHTTGLLIFTKPSTKQIIEPAIYIKLTKLVQEERCADVVQVVAVDHHIQEAVTIVVDHQVLVEASVPATSTPTVFIRHHQQLPINIIVHSIRKHTTSCTCTIGHRIIIMLGDTTQPPSSSSITMATAITSTMVAMGITNTPRILKIQQLGIL